MSRVQDWLVQSQAFQKDARRLHKKKSYYLVCFSCQQSAEFAPKAICVSKNMHSWGHDLLSLLQVLKTQGNLIPPTQIEQACSILSKYYISTRYPDAYKTGAPSNLFSKQESERAIQLAKEVGDFAIKSI